MSISHTQRCIPQLGFTSKGPSHEEVMNKLHLRKAKAEKSYYDNVRWLVDMVNEGQLKPEKLQSQAISADQSSSHRSPITTGLRKLYQDNSWAKLIEGVDIKLPGLYVHLVASLITEGQLAKDDLLSAQYSISNSALA